VLYLARPVSSWVDRSGSWAQGDRVFGWGEGTGALFNWSSFFPTPTRLTNPPDLRPGSPWRNAVILDGFTCFAGDPSPFFFSILDSVARRSQGGRRGPPRVSDLPCMVF